MEIRLLEKETIEKVIAEAKEILDELGFFIENKEAIKRAYDEVKKLE